MLTTLHLVQYKEVKMHFEKCLLIVLEKFLIIYTRAISRTYTIFNAEYSMVNMKHIHINFNTHTQTNRM